MPFFFSFFFFFSLGLERETESIVQMAKKSSGNEQRKPRIPQIEAKKGNKNGKNHKHTCRLQGKKLGSSVTHTSHICVIKLSVFVGAKNLGNLPLMGLKTESVNSIISSQFFIFVFVFVFVCFSLPSSRIQNWAEKKGKFFFFQKIKK